MPFLTFARRTFSRRWRMRYPTFARRWIFMNSVKIELHGKAFSLRIRLSQTLGASDHIDIKNISKNTQR